VGAGQIPFDRVLTDLNRMAKIRAKLRIAGGGTEVGLGIMLLFQATPALYGDLSELADAKSGGEKAWLRVGENGSLALGGGLMTVSGAINIGSGFSQAVAGNSRLMAVSRWSGRVGTAAIILAEGFALWQYQRGWMTERQLWTAQSSLAGGVVGGAAGAWAGAKAGTLVGGGIGAIFGPEGIPVGMAIGGAIGGIGGALGGSYLGSTWATRGVESYYAFKNKDTERRFDEFLYAHYGCN
jgi:hypothetical protein